MTLDDSIRPRERFLSWLARTLVFFGAGLLLLVGSALYFFGSLGSALAYLTSSGLTADRSSKSFGEVKQGERVRIMFHLTNRSDQRITVVGAKTKCTCVVAEALPMVVPAGSRCSINVAVNTDSREGEIREPVQFFTDFPDQRELRLSVEGRVLAPEAKSGQKKTSR
jgi:Protein of unknown function (DUF1573)